MGPPGNPQAGIREGNHDAVWACGVLNWGGKPVSSYQCINVSRIQRQLVSIYQYNKDTWRQEATILRFSSILPKAPTQPGDPHKGGRRIVNFRKIQKICQKFKNAINRPLELKNGHLFSIPCFFFIRVQDTSGVSLAAPPAFVEALTWLRPGARSGDRLFL